MKRPRLFTPGPTDVPPEVLEILAKPLVHHRTDTFRNIYFEVIRDLQLVLATANPVVALTSSGTGVMESVVVNMTQPGEKVVVTTLGKFSERWREIAEAYRLNVVAVEAEWGDPVTPERLEETMEKHPDISIVFTTHSETSTGVLQDVGAFAEIAARHGSLIAVDAISSVAAHEIRTDAWGLDAKRNDGTARIGFCVAIAKSQKQNGGGPASLLLLRPACRRKIGPKRRHSLHSRYAAGFCFAQSAKDDL